MKHFRLLGLTAPLFFISCLNPFIPDSSEYSEPNSVYIYSVTATPTDSEQITLKNNSGSTVDLSKWTLGDLNNPTAYSIPSDTIIGSGSLLSFSRTTLGFQINDDGETLYLKDAFGITIDTWYN